MENYAIVTCPICGVTFKCDDGWLYCSEECTEKMLESQSDVDDYEFD